MDNAIRGKYNQKRWRVCAEPCRAGLERIGKPPLENRDLVMTRLLRRFRFVALVLVLCTAAVAEGQDEKKSPAKGASGVEGIWEGPLKVGAVELRLVFKITKEKDGALKGTMDSIDQGAKDIPITSVTVKDGQVEMVLKNLGAKYEGKLEKDGAELKGEFHQGGLKLPLNLKRTKTATTLKRPQEPKKPFPYREEEVLVANEKADVKLAGTLTLPKGDGPFSAVLLITGSGQQNRDEELMGHKPFAVIADYLTRRGIAVLRVDDRGVGKSTGKVAEATSEDFVGDALACVAYLKRLKEINPKQIGLIGHSEGGMIAPMAAVKSEDVAFIVLLAGPGVSGEEILYGQGQAILKAAKVPGELLARQKRVQEAMFAIVKAEKDLAVAEKKLKEFFDKEIAALSDEEKKEAAKNQQKGAAEAQIKQVLSPWFRFFLTYDPRPTLRKVKCPVLAINGELDLQVLPKENLAGIEKALKEGGNQDFTVKELPKLNHLFQHAQTGAPGEYGKIEETFAPQALELIGDWIVQRTKKSE
jgi:pimeloyl-ACP methyl ester carboxylesterase